ncbi:hypothetical protein C8Q76DRAFT_573623, partial [Earliella scabrosa]
LRNGGVIFEMGDAAGAAWLRDRSHSELFTAKLGVSAQIKPRAYKIIALFAPVRFDPESSMQLSAMEADADLPAQSILSARWIKQPSRRGPNQQVAHLMIEVSTPEAANAALRRGLVIAGKKVSARKNIPEPLRCHRCQRLGVSHLAAKCPQDYDTCGTCGSTRHRTSECAVMDSEKFHCVSCDQDGHASWDRCCPTLLDHQRRLLARQVDGLYRFFPTEDPSTW